MKKKDILLKMTIISCFLLSGCWDANEPERMHYAHGLGIDYKNGKFVVYLQIVNLTSIGKTEGGSSGTTSQADIGHASGKTFDQAVYNLYKTFNRRVYWGHLSFIIFSEKALKHNVFSYITDFLDRYRETRYRIFYYATKDDIKKELLATPIGNLPLGLMKLSDPTSIYRQSSLVRSVDLRNVIIGLNEPNHQILIPFISLGTKWDNTQKPKTSIKTDAIAVLSGVREPKIRGIMSGKSIRGLRWLEKESDRDIIPLKKDGKIVGTVIAIVGKRKIIPVTKDGQTTKFRININVKASIEIMAQNFNVSELRKMIAKEIKSQVNSTYLEALDKKVDIYRLSEVLYRQDNHVWKKIQVNGQIPLDKNSIQVIVNIRIKDTGKLSTRTSL